MNKKEGLIEIIYTTSWLNKKNIKELKRKGWKIKCFLPPRIQISKNFKNSKTSSIELTLIQRMVSKNCHKLRDKLGGASATFAEQHPRPITHPAKDGDYEIS